MTKNKKVKTYQVGNDDHTACPRSSARKKAFLKANDLNSLIMLGSSLGDSELMQYVGRKALQIQHFSAAFSSFWMLRDLAMCHQTLIDSKRYYPYLYITCKNKL